MKLKRARIALRQGRLDDAYALAIDRQLEDHREGQQLLSDLVSPLLERAREHLAANRHSAALLDAERALRIAGNDPEVKDLRDRVQREARDRENRARRERELVLSVRRHLNRGSVGAGRERIEDLPAGATQRALLEREVKTRERHGEEARAQAVEHLARNEVLLAIAAARKAHEAWSGNPTLGPLLADLRRHANARIEAALDEGDIGAAAALHRSLRGWLADDLEGRRFGEVLVASHEAAQRVQAGDPVAAREVLARLRKLLPRAGWVADSLAQVDAVADNLRELRAGPLGSSLASEPAAPRTESGTLPRVHAPFLHERERPVNGKPVAEPLAAGSGELPRRFLLWIDGVGTFLVLTGDQISIGRAGSGAEPDLALRANLAGAHAEVARLDEDYFLSGIHGEVRVNGKRTARKLLADGDAIALGDSCRLLFRRPTGMSSSAVLRLRDGLRVEGDARDVILLDRLLLIGSGAQCHIQVANRRTPIVLLRRGDGFACRCDDGVEVDGKVVGREAALEFRQHVRVGEVTFTLTRARTGGGL